MTWMFMCYVIIPKFNLVFKGTIFKNIRHLILFEHGFLFITIKTTMLFLSHNTELLFNYGVIYLNR